MGVDVFACLSYYCRVTLIGSRFRQVHSSFATLVVAPTQRGRTIVVICTWQRQDVCALSKYYEPCKQSSWSRARNLQENRPFLTASGVGNQSPTWTVTVHEKRPRLCIPANARSPITAGWTGGRQMEHCQSEA